MGAVCVGVGTGCRGRCGVDDGEDLDPARLAAGGSVLLDQPGEGVGVEMPERGTPLEIGRGRIVKEGTKIALLSYGTRLQEALAANGMTTIGEPIWARYDPPFKPWFMRRNEILIPVS